jgi:hypothetical protein
MNKERVKGKDNRRISLTKAVKIMTDYQNNGYNAYQTLIKHGYSEQYAKANARYTIDACSDRIKQSLQLDDANNNKEVAQTLYDVIGLSKQDVLNELVKIIKQDLNYAVKLRALEPFVRQEGIKWDEKEEQKAPQVVIKVDEVHNNYDNQDTIEAINVENKG